MYDFPVPAFAAARMKIEITNETGADVAAIRAITTSAFLHAPHTSHTEQFVVDALREAGRLTVSLVAWAGAKPVRHIAISPRSAPPALTALFPTTRRSTQPAEHRSYGASK
jgi:putative acetyltransferase